MPPPAGRGTNQEAIEEAALASCLCAEGMAHSFFWGQTGNWGRCPEAMEQCLLGLHSSCLYFTSC